MKVFLHNSLTKKKELFVPAQKNIVKIYVCGVTVYDLCHLGHARGAINFDVLKKLFQTLGYQVIFVKNYTDIDDKIIAESNKLNIPSTLVGVTFFYQFFYHSNHLSYIFCSFGSYIGGLYKKTCHIPIVLRYHFFCQFLDGYV